MAKIKKDCSLRFSMALLFMLVGIFLSSDSVYSLPYNLLRPSHSFDSGRKKETSERFRQIFRKRYGGKTLGIIKLTKFAKQLGFKVPYFDKIGTGIFNGFLERNSITREKIDAIYAKNLVDKDSEEYKSQKPHYFDWIMGKVCRPNAYREIKDLFYNAEFTPEQETQLRQVFKKMLRLGCPVIAIRSSSILEDSRKYQFKGKHKALS